MDGDNVKGEVGEVLEFWALFGDEQDSEGTSGGISSMISFAICQTFNTEYLGYLANSLPTCITRWR